MNDTRQVKITPESLEGFKLLQQLGQGSTGTVFKAKLLSSGEVLAVKILFPALSKQPDFNEKFLRVAQAAGKLQHPNIVRTYEAGTSGPFHYVVMEYVEAKNLESVLSRGAMDEQRALQIALSISRALAHAQQVGIVHRDVKPANILLPRGAEAKLADLGLATMATNPKLVGGVTGTPHYLAPESARGEAPDARADVYSLGATLYHMLTGQTVFTSPSVADVVAAQLSERPKPPMKVNAGVSEQASRLVERMLEKKAGDRPWPAEVVGLIEAILRGEKPLSDKLARRAGAEKAESGFRISRDSPTPAMPPPSIPQLLPHARITTPQQETIASPYPPAEWKAQPPGPPAYPAPPPWPSSAPPPVPPQPGAPVRTSPSPYPPMPPYVPPPYPPGPSGTPPAPPAYPPPPQTPPGPNAPTQPYPQAPAQPWPPSAPTSPYPPFPPQGYPPPPPPFGGQPAAPPTTAPPGGGGQKKPPPKKRRGVGRRWGDLI